MSQGIIQRGGVYRQRITTFGSSVTGGMKRKGVRIPEFAVGLLIVASCVGGALMWQNSQDSGVSVLITSRLLTRGAQVQASDLITAHISSDTDIALLPSSAVLLQAIRFLRTSQLGPAYAEAWSESSLSGDEELWDTTSGDGVE